MSKITRIGRALLDREAGGDRRVWFRLVTTQVDRHGTIINPAGVRLDDHKNNPVFVWMHDYSRRDDGSPPPPDVVIGRVVEYDQTAENLDICVEFDVDEFADLCLQKVRRGFLNMVSIGCNVLAEGKRKIGTREVPYYAETDLLEASLVIIGSNRGALKLDRAAAAEIVRAVEAPIEEPEPELAIEPAPAPAPEPDRFAQLRDAAVALWGERGIGAAEAARAFATAPPAEAPATHAKPASPASPAPATVQHDVPAAAQASPYLPGVRADSAPPSDRRPERNRDMPVTPKKTDSARWAFRGLLGSALECLETMAYVVDAGLVEDESAGAMRAHMDAEMAALDDWAGAYRATFSAVDGVVRAAPELKDAALKTRFVELYAKIGPLPRSERSLLAQYLGDEAAKDPERLEERLLALTEDSKQLVVVREAAKVTAAEADRIARDKAITDGLDKRLITPAEAKAMRGLNPATGAEDPATAWSRGRVERYVADREKQGGAVASIARMGEVNPVEPQQGKPPVATPGTLIRFGGSGTGGGLGLTEDALAQMAGVSPEKIRGYAETAAGLQSSEAHPAIARAAALKQ